MYEIWPIEFYCCCFQLYSEIPSVVHIFKGIIKATGDIFKFYYDFIRFNKCFVIKNLHKV